MASKYNGTMVIKEALTSPFQSMPPMPSINFNTHIQKYLNMHHTNGNTQTMEKKIMGQRGNFIRYPTRKEKKKSKIGGKVYILWPGSRPRVTIGTWINHSRSIKRKNLTGHLWQGATSLVFQMMPVQEKHTSL